jgi:hypothetical protein
MTLSIREAYPEWRSQLFRRKGVSREKAGFVPTLSGITDLATCGGEQKEDA